MRAFGRCLAVLAIAIGCGDEPAGDPAHRDAVATATDPVAAAQAVRALAAESCEGLASALGLLDRRAAGPTPWDAATLRGLVGDAMDAARRRCPDEQARRALAGYVGQARALGRARLAGGRPDVALADLALAPPSPAVLRERAGWLSALRRTAEARRDLALSLALEEDADTRASVAFFALRAGNGAEALRIAGDGDAPRLRDARAAALAALGRYDDAAREVASAPVYLRRQVADAAAVAAGDRVALADVADAPHELIVAAATRVRRDDPARAARLLARAAELAPKDSILLAALAETREAAGDTAGAVDAWDRAAAVTFGDPRSVLAPIRILADTGDTRDAARRADALAAAARASSSADDLHTASLAAEYAKDPEAAVALAREASAARPTDGRLRSELGTRLERAGRHADAADVLAALLVCGAHGRPWHRHDLAKRLAALRDIDKAAVTAALSKVDCAPVDEPDLAVYLEQLGAN